MQFDGTLVTLTVVIANPMTIAVLVVADLDRPRAARRLSGADMADSALCRHWADRARRLDRRSAMLCFISAGTRWSRRFRCSPTRVPPPKARWPRSGSPLSSLRRRARRRCTADFCSAVGPDQTAWHGRRSSSSRCCGRRLHLQYDWTGILLIFVVGLFLGWMRWRSGSTLLTFLLHALFNVESTLETAAHLLFVKVIDACVQTTPR